MYLDGGQNAGPFNVNYGPQWMGVADLIACSANDASLTVHLSGLAVCIRILCRDSKGACCVYQSTNAREQLTVQLSIRGLVTA